MPAVLDDPSYLDPLAASPSRLHAFADDLEASGDAETARLVRRAARDESTLALATAPPALLGAPTESREDTVPA